MNYIKEIFVEFFEKFREILNIPSNFVDIIASPITALAILGCILIFIVLIKVRKINVNTQIITRISLALALSCILGMIRLYHFPQGGSITPGRFVPIFIISFMYGPEIGLFTGLISGVLDFFLDPYILSPIQVLFDYPLAFMMLGLSGFFRTKKSVGVIVGTLGRMLCSIISGVVFFWQYAPEGMHPLVYSLIVNVPVMGLEGLICVVLIKLLPIDEIINQLSEVPPTLKG